MRRIALVIFIAAFAGLAAAQVKTTEPVPVKVPFEKSLQMVVVTTKDWNVIQGTARLFERKNARAKWKAVGDPFDVVIGRSGLAWGEDPTNDTAVTKIKKEGDGNSPAGRFPLTTAFGMSTKPSGVELSYTKLGEYTECVDDVNSSFYNRIVDRMQVGNFNWKSSEKMLAVGPEYDLGMVVAHNTFPITRGNGSCIFLHIWKDAQTGTSGCTAMERRNLERLLAWASTARNPYLVQLPDELYDKYRKPWKLPKIK